MDSPIVTTLNSTADHIEHGTINANHETAVGYLKRVAKGKTALTIKKITERQPGLLLCSIIIAFGNNNNQNKNIL